MTNSVEPAVTRGDHCPNPFTQTLPLVARAAARPATTIRIGEVTVGGDQNVLIAGPCAVENYTMLCGTAMAVKDAGAHLLRGGAYKPRTSPYTFQGLGERGLDILRQVRSEVGIGVVCEVIDPRDVDLVLRYEVDVLQIGARNMQNFPLLVEVGRCRCPVLLKRGPCATLTELLSAAEYILHQGNPNVILCERGVSPLDRTFTRNTLDLNAVPVLKALTHLPVIVDPSHGVGDANYVSALSRAAVAAGADGLMLEVHPDPRQAVSDGKQSLDLDQFARLVPVLRRVAEAVERPLAPALVAEVVQ